MLTPSHGIQQPSSAGIPVNKGKYSWGIGCGRATYLDVDFSQICDRLSGHRSTGHRRWERRLSSAVLAVEARS
jgi:hypothetical protein